MSNVFELITQNKDFSEVPRDQRDLLIQQLMQQNLTEISTELERMKIKQSSLEEEVKQVKTVVENEVTLNHPQQTALNHAIKKRVESLWNDGVRGTCETKRQMYAKIHSQLRRAFLVPSYMVVKKKEYDDAISWVKSWRPF